MGTCGYPTLDGEPCENPVALGSDHCAANHPVVSRSSGIALPAANVGPSTSPDFEDLVSGGSGSPPEQKHDDPPLKDFRVIGIAERTTVINPGTKFAREVAAGSCWHCGTSIRICVVAKNEKTGDVVEVGQTCAERIGLDKKGLKEYLAERFAEQRLLRSKAYQEQQRAEYEAWEEEQTGKFGPHGSLSRYEGGCSRGGAICEECRQAAPHGSVDHFWAHRCNCHPCVEAAMERNRDLYISGDVPMLVDLQTGKIVPEAKMVSGQYGTSWWIPGGVYVPAFRKRRDTVARRGYTYARAKVLMERSHQREVADRKVRVLEAPTVDEWGEPIPTGG